MSFTVVNIAVQLVVTLFAISFHESAHAWMALRFGDTTARDAGRISLNPIHHIDPFGSVLLPLICILFHAPIFGYARPTPVDLRQTRNPRLANFWVSVAGPGSNFLVAGIAAALLYVARGASPGLLGEVLRGHMPGGILAPIAYLLIYLLLVNVILGVFNLIPIPPMDGSGILFSLLGRRGLAIEYFFHRHAMVMFLLLIVLVNLGVFGLILDPVINTVFRWILGGA